MGKSNKIYEPEVFKLPLSVFSIFLSEISIEFYTEVFEISTNYLYSKF